MQRRHLTQLNGAGGAGPCETSAIALSAPAVRSSDDLRISVDGAFACQATPGASSVMQIPQSAIDGTSVQGFACPAAMQAGGDFDLSLGAMVVEQLSYDAGPVDDDWDHLSVTSIDAAQNVVFERRVGALPETPNYVTVADRAHGGVAESYMLVDSSSNGLLDVATQNAFVEPGSFVVRHDASSGALERAYISSGFLGETSIAVGDGKIIVSARGSGQYTFCGQSPTGVAAGQRFAHVTAIDAAASFANATAPSCLDTVTMLDPDASDSFEINHVDATDDRILVTGSYIDQIALPLKEVAATPESFGQTRKGFAMLLTANCAGDFDVETVTVTAKRDVRLTHGFFQGSSTGVWLVGESAFSEPITMRRYVAGPNPTCTTMAELLLAGDAFAMAFDPQQATWTIDGVSGDFANARVDVGAAVGPNAETALLVASDNVVTASSPHADCAQASGRGIFALSPASGCSFTTL